MQSEFRRGVETRKQLTRNESRDANFSSTFLGKIGEIRQVTNIAGSTMGNLT